MLHQPCRRNFVLRIQRRIARNLNSFRRCSRCQFLELAALKHGILEERSRAAAIVVSGNNQHALASPYFAHRLAYFSKRRRRLFLSIRNRPQIFLQIGILQTRRRSPLQPVIHPQDDVPPTFGAVERCWIDNGIRRLAWAKPQCGLPLSRRRAPIRSYRNLLPICANVLHGRPANAARNAAQALDSRAILHDRLRDKVIPVDACAHAEQHGVTRGAGP